MISSRALDVLRPVVKAKAVQFQMLCKANGIDILILSTYRDKEAQDALYAIGRSTGVAGHIVTNAKGGESFHQYFCAFDAVPLVNGKPFWTVFDAKGKMLQIWETVADCAKAAGLEWAGNWEKFKEYDHFQYTGGLTLTELQEGKVIA
jgi:peptidoglycan L-alanyl-D-glutamate endopeptidase CwlK